MIGGWYDLFLASQMEDFERLGSRAKSRMLIGPWHHLQLSDVPYEGDIGAEGQLAMILDWLGHHLKGEPLEQQVGVIETYAFGEGKWHVRDRFPPETSTVTLHLDELARSNACDGGRLAPEAPADPGSISYRYDPKDPVPTRGGEKLLGFAFRTFDSPDPGSVDQAGLCEREDVLTFVSEPLEAALHVAGRMQVALEVRSDVEDTAFTAKLIEVDGGSARNVRDGIATLIHRTGDEAETHSPGERVTVRIDLWPIEWRFPAGARIRLDVSSSNFPAFHAHPNRAGPWASVKEPIVATQTIEGGRVSLPVLRAE
jgi:putative CocE/NonD family hydrolase